jgi:nucleoside-diphosphate-sugar epimerase
MARYTVTGGAGFIGSHLTEELLRRGHQVRVVDNFSTGRRENVQAALAAAVADGATDAASRLEVLEGDLADLDVARKACAGADYVLHQAAIPSVPRSVQDPISSNRANIDATLNVLVAARDAGVKRLVFAGSSSEYGDTPTLPKHEEMPTDPLSPYALQKVVGEQYLKQFTRLYGLETVSVRYFNVFGPRQDPGSPYSGSSRCSSSGCSRDRRPPSTATASRRATSLTWPTWSTACCARARRPMPRVKPSTSLRPGASR